MIAKETLGLFGIIAIIGFGGYKAYNSYQSANTARTNLAKSNQELTKASNKSIRLINETGKGVIYLAPKGATASRDDDASKLNAILTNLFNYKNPDKFANQAEIVKPQITGEFANYWFDGGIKREKEGMILQGNGRNVARYGEINLTKYNAGHYFAIVKTGVLIGDQNKSESKSVLFGLDITKQNNNLWNIQRIKGFSSVDQNNSSSQENYSSDSDD